MTVAHQDGQAVAAIAADRILAVVVLDDAGTATPLAEALLAGGLRTVEVTLRTPAALDAIRVLAARSDLVVGAGTALTAEQVDRCVDAGAQFVVSPGFAPAVVARCRERGMPVFPGVATPTEIQMALDAGLETVKFFPAGLLGGPPMVKALAAPFGSVRFIPTGGVDAGNLRAYLDLPAVVAVGGTWLAAADLVAAGRWDEITRRSAAAVAAVAAAAGGVAP